MTTPNAKRNAAILALTDGGMSQKRAAQHLGLTRNTVVGVRARAGRGVPKTPISTLFDRMDTLNARMDAVLGVTLGVGRVPNEPRKR